MVRVKYCGIYKILNTVNDNFYIGSSVDITGRLSQHRSSLKKGTHHNMHLQNAWNKYGEGAFTFTIIEECQPIKQVLLEREQYYIDTLKPAYNHLLIAGSRLGSKHTYEVKAKISNSSKGKTFSAATRKKLSIALMGKVVSDETKRNMSESHIGKKLTDEQKAKIGKSGEGRVVSEETRSKISLGNKGKPKSQEHRNKIALNNKANTPDVRKKMSEAKKKKIPGETIEIILNEYKNGLSFVKISKIVNLSDYLVSRVVSEHK